MGLVDKNINSDTKSELRRRRQPEAARDNILAAAEALLIAAGPQSLKLADVARAAGVSNATVLHHFGSIAEAQTALMERMVRQLVLEILTIARRDGAAAHSATGEIAALFDAFESRGAARLAAWLELTGEARRITFVQTAVREVVEARVGEFASIPDDLREDLMLACATMALGVGLFGPTLSELIGKPADRARDVVLGVLLDHLRGVLASV
ncbi:MAG TPA: TetR/AcrR family transcriptional regulator [Caulobacteraceae bacterium]|jgi:AcrR family transcriptional regulator